jgi:hypothetical protein
VSWLSRFLSGSEPPPAVAPDIALARPGVVEPATELNEEVLGPAVFDVWRDPNVGLTSSEWEKRLYAYARKCAVQLAHDGVALFRCEWPRGGVGTYSDAFWLVAMDVRRANRSWNKNVLHSGEMPVRGHPPPAGKNEFDGQFWGRALLLTPLGVLCTADARGFFAASAGSVNGQTMDVQFTNIRVDAAQCNHQTGVGATPGVGGYTRRTTSGCTASNSPLSRSILNTNTSPAPTVTMTAKEPA